MRLQQVKTPPVFFRTSDWIDINGLYRNDKPPLRAWLADCTLRKHQYNWIYFSRMIHFPPPGHFLLFTEENSKLCSNYVNDRGDCITANFKKEARGAFWWCEIKEEAGKLLINWFAESKSANQLPVKYRFFLSGTLRKNIDNIGYNSFILYH